MAGEPKQVWHVLRRDGEAAQHRVQYSGHRVFIGALGLQRCAAQEPTCS